MVFHWAGAAWSIASAVGTTDDFRGLWGRGPNEVWAVGANGAVIRWDGTAWGTVRRAPHDVYAVWGSTAGEVWIVGDYGTILHYQP
jgi:hypothetical protein